MAIFVRGCCGILPFYPLSLKMILSTFCAWEYAVKRKITESQSRKKRKCRDW